MKAAIYLRVSTDLQDETNQEAPCLEICKARGWEYRIFREVVSGASKLRPQWEALKAGVHRGEYRAVVFWAMDRAGRDRRLLLYDIDEFYRKGVVAVVSVKEPMLDQPPGPMRDLSQFWLAQMAQIERERIVDRTNLGLAPIKKSLERNGMWVSKRSGKVITKLGRPPVVVDVARARALLAEGKSETQVAKVLGAARATIKKALSEKGGQSEGSKVAKNRGEDVPAGDG